jgi:hypothetical protein
MDRTGLVLTLLLPGLLLAGAARAQSDAPHAADKQAAQAAAREWLALLEDQDVEESWEAAAAPFRERTDREAWGRRATRLADSVGAPAARTLTAAQYRDTLRAAAAEGPFVVLAYRTRFAAGRYEELVLVARSEDDWRVAGYRVRPLRAPDPPMPTRPESGPGQ